MIHITVEDFVHIALLYLFIVIICIWEPFCRPSSAPSQCFLMETQHFKVVIKISGGKEMRAKFSTHTLSLSALTIRPKKIVGETLDIVSFYYCFFFSYLLDLLKFFSCFVERCWSLLALITCEILQTRQSEAGFEQRLGFHRDGACLVSLWEFVLIDQALLFRKVKGV